MKEVRKRAPRKTPNLDEVIEVAIELLLEHGEGGFRIEDVIERTGISKSSLYLICAGTCKNSTHDSLESIRCVVGSKVPT